MAMANAEDESLWEVPPGKILGSGGPENAISQSTIDVKVVRKLMEI